MWLTLTAVVLGGAPKVDEAEALFRKMEQPILKAKSFQAGVAIVAGDQLNTKGSLAVGPGNKVRLELTGPVRKMDTKMLMVSDGTNMRMSMDGKPGKDQPVKDKLTDITLASMARGGVFLPLFTVEEGGKEGEKPEPFDIEKRLAVSGFKLGKKEVVGGREAQAVEHQLKLKTVKDPLPVTVWIDLKSYLPVKRVVKSTEGDKTFEITETYTDVSVDKTLDDKLFDLSK